MEGSCVQWIGRFAVLACFALLGLTACEPVGYVEPEVASATQELVGGMSDTADPAVVTLEMDIAGDSGGCTASFIDRNVLLTAAHCVSDDYGRMPAGAKYRFYRGPDLRAAAAPDWIAVQAKNVHAHPKYDPNSSANDVAVLVLDQPLDVTPIPLNTQALTPDMVGMQVRLVGYGSTTGVSGPNDGFGLKRVLSTTIQMVQSDVVLIGNTGQQACDGDSGGPALLKVNGVETLVGTDDYNANGFNCTNGDYYQRVDRQLAFIMPFLSAQGSAPTLPTDGGVPSRTGGASAGGASAGPGVAGGASIAAGSGVTTDAGVLQPSGGSGSAPSGSNAATAPARGAAGAAGYAAIPTLGSPAGGSTGAASASHAFNSTSSPGCSLTPANGDPRAIAHCGGPLLLALILMRRRARLFSRGAC